MIDVADWQVIMKFADAPFVLEAPMTASNYAARAAKILAGARIKVDTSDLGDVPYRKALDGVRKQVEAEFGGTDDRIEFLDISQKDLKKEAKRIDKSLVRDAEGFREEVGERGAITFGILGASKKPICVVVGPRSDRGVREFFKDTEYGVDVSGIKNEDLYQVMLWHELGHCLLGGSENKADTFSALMNIRYSDNRKIIPLLATWRELDEWSAPEFDGDYFVSKTLWNVLAVEDQLRNSPKFMSMGIRDIASFANEVAEKFGFSNEEIEHRRRFRVSLNTIADMKAHYIPIENGVQKVRAEDWVAFHSETVAEFSRITALIENLKFGSVALKPFEPDLNDFKSSIKEMGKGGDKTAGVLLRSYTKNYKISAVNREEKIGPRIGFRPNQSEGLNEVIAVKKDSQKITFSENNNIWVIHDKLTGNLVSAGSVTLDRKWSVIGYNPPEEATRRSNAFR